MKLLAFRIKSFRSIVDTGWSPFSPDGVTALVGQNESGKTSVLEALSCTFSNLHIAEDDLRADAPYPEIFIRVEVQPSLLEAALPTACPEQLVALRQYCTKHENKVELVWTWQTVAKESEQKYDCSISLLDDGNLKAVLNTAWTEFQAKKPAKTPAVYNVASLNESDAEAEEADEEEAAAAPEDTGPLELTLDHITDEIFRLSPNVILFNSENGLLPNQIDIDDKGQPIGAGAIAASNFLSIAEIDLKKLLGVDRRTRESILNKANDLVSRDFGSFWSQTIGKNDRLSLRCEVDNYPASFGAKAGRPHLVFWIKDGNTQLYPKQRSQGVRWFISFYLQLKASEKRGGSRMFLLDEPGANLHSKAQTDVLRLINKLSDELAIVYSTHSPHLIEYNKLYRVHAVQRDGEQDDSPTIIIDAHKLGAASTDTLSPVLGAMGVDMSNQQVIRKSHNVLLEEISGFYYLLAFWKLSATKQTAHFLSATGVNKLETLANLFLGWGLEFIVVIDDDKQGRGVYNSLKRDFFGDEHALADKKMWKISGCDGIEDVFSRNDFRSFVLRDMDAVISGKNTEYLRDAGRSKPVMAYQFWMDVESKKIEAGQLEGQSMEKIKEVVTEVTKRL